LERDHFWSIAPDTLYNVYAEQGEPGIGQMSESWQHIEQLLKDSLLQTAAFTRALINGASPGLAPELVERRVMARMVRQQILTRTNPLRYHVIILERPVGTPAIMRNQLRRLIDEAAADHITLRILPKAAGASPAIDGPFSILTLPEPIPDFGYAEGPGGAAYIEDRADVRTCILKWASSPSARYPQPTRWT
jgi:hypothetical protein